MEDHDDNRSKSSRSLGGFLAIGAEGPLWQADDLAAILKHQLEAPIEFDLSLFEKERPPSLDSLHSITGPPIRTFGDLFHHPRPPVALLESAKEFAKACRNRQDGPLPDEIASILYTLSIVVARTKCDARISEADSQILRGGLEWAIRQNWVDESTRELLRAGQVGIETVDSGGAPDATPAMSSPQLPVRKELGEYVLLEEIGQGGMGTVYKALHTQLDRVVALKVLPKSRMLDEQVIARFQREMKAVGRLDHPNIVRAHDAREIDGTYFLVMEHVEGIDLAELVRRLGPLPVADACELIRQTALGLEYAHRHGLVHRDIKPSNLMITRQGQVKILDLGLARICGDQAASAEMTAVGQVMGTPDYIAPEQVSDSRSVDIRADIYSLGCTLYKLLTGEAPFARADYKSLIERMFAHTRDPVPPIEQFRTGLPDDLIAAVGRMLEKDTEKRFAEPGEVAAVMERFAAGSRPAALLAATEGTPPQLSEGISEPVAEVAKLPKRRNSCEFRYGESVLKRPVVVISAAVLLVAALGLVFFIAGRGGEGETAAGGGSSQGENGESGSTPGPGQPAAPADPAAAAVGTHEWIVLSWCRVGFEKPNLWLCSPDGKRKIQITSEPDQFDTHPHFSPDGRRIAFVRGTDPREPTSIWICDSGGGNARCVVASEDSSQRLLSPVWISNSHVHYVRDPRVDRFADVEVRQVDVDSGEQQFVFRLAETIGEGGALVTDVSPDGRQLAIVAQRPGEIDTSDVYVTDLRGQLVQSLWEDPSDNRKDARALWSPAGKTIAWQHDFPPEHNDADGRPSAIRTGVAMAGLEPGGTWRARLQPAEAVPLMPLAWSPDGRSLLCARVPGDRFRGSRPALLLMDEQFAVRTLMLLDTRCWHPDQPDLGRLADWAAVPDDVERDGGSGGTRATD